MIRLAVFASGNGSNLQALIDACKGGKLAARIEVVISNNSDAYALERARIAHIAAIHISKNNHPVNDDYVFALESTLSKYKVDLIVLAGYMKLLPSEIVKKHSGRIINIHPALLPKYGGPGMYGMNVHRAVLASGDKFGGATVHIVDEKYDHGPILIQRHVYINKNDTPESLAARVLTIEHQILPLAVALYIK
jgi:phosphoribosylglycinamide formyltransferase 1